MATDKVILKDFGQCVYIDYKGDTNILFRSRQIMHRESKILSRKCTHKTLMKWKRKSRDKSDESEDTGRGEMDNYINQNINGLDNKDVIEIVVD